MIIEITQYAAPYEVYAPDAFDAEIGKQIRVKTLTSGDTIGTLVSVVVAADGKSFTARVDVPRLFEAA